MPPFLHRGKMCGEKRELMHCSKNKWHQSILFSLGHPVVEYLLILSLSWQHFVLLHIMKLCDSWWKIAQMRHSPALRIVKERKWMMLCVHTTEKCCVIFIVHWSLCRSLTKTLNWSLEKGKQDISMCASCLRILLAQFKSSLWVSLQYYCGAGICGAQLCSVLTLCFLKSYRIEPKFWHCAHSFEPSSRANCTLVLITSPSLVPITRTLLVATFTHIFGAKRVMLFGASLVQFIGNRLPQTSVNWVCVFHYFKSRRSSVQTDSDWLQHVGNLSAITNEIVVNCKPQPFCLRVIAACPSQTRWPEQLSCNGRQQAKNKLFP